MRNINTKIALSALSILTSLALVGGATFAFFNDPEISTQNVFEAGNLDLVLCDNNEPCASEEGPEDSVTASFGDSNMAPGDCTGDQTLTLRNTGSIDGNHVDIAASNTNGDMAPFLRINNLKYDGAPVVIANSNGTVFADLQDLALAGMPNLLPGISAGTQKNLVMDVCLDNSAPNTLQGAANTLDLTATLQQAPHGSE